MKNFVRVLVCLALTSFAVAKAVTPHKAAAAATPATKTAPKKATGQKADAKTLLGNANKALAAMIKNARADKTLDPRTAKNKPFWKSVQLIAKNLKTAQSGLSAKNNDFFKGITEARKAEQQMKIDWQLTNSKNKGVIVNGKKLGYSLALLRTDFSKEAARKKKGGELTAAEKAQFAKIKAQQKDLLAKTRALASKTQKDKALAKGLQEIQSQANQILKKPATLDGYIATLYLLDLQIGLIRGYEYYVDKAWRDDYITLVTFPKWYDTWYYEWSEPAAYDWVYLDTPVDVYEEVEVPDSLSDEDIASQDEFVESEPLDMSDAEEDEVAANEDSRRRSGGRSRGEHGRRRGWPRRRHERRRSG